MTKTQANPMAANVVLSKSGTAKSSTPTVKDNSVKKKVAS
jgi:hypothetical protein